jgi:hypothetical protein
VLALVHVESDQARAPGSRTACRRKNPEPYRRYAGTSTKVVAPTLFLRLIGERRPGCRSSTSCEHDCALLSLVLEYLGSSQSLLCFTTIQLRRATKFGRTIVFGKRGTCVLVGLEVQLHSCGRGQPRSSQWSRCGETTNFQQ